MQSYKRKGRAIVFFPVLLLLIFVTACSSRSTDDDGDSDMFDDNLDNCPEVYNPDQVATIGLSTDLGDVCDDEDADSIVDVVDNCPLTNNVDQIDSDGNGVGDACETCGVITKITDLADDGTSVVLGQMASLNNKLYFRAQDDAHGNELWRLDTSDNSRGAEMVADIASGEVSSSPTMLTEVGGKLFFRAQDSEHGVELWTYEPDKGAALATDIQPGVGDAYPNWLTAMDRRLYFSADDGIHGRELWMYDPANASAGAIMVSDINPVYGSNPRDFASLDGRLYFIANDGVVRLKLWMYEPGAGATFVADLMKNDPGSNAYADNLVALDGKLYFRYWGPEGFGLWVHDRDAPEENTRPIAWVPNHFADEPRDLVALDGKLYFTTSVPLYGRELWTYDPQIPAAGATLVVDAFPGVHSGRPSPEYDTSLATPFLDTLNPVFLDGLIYMNGNNGVSGHELMSFDPSMAATSLRLVTDINVGPENSYPMNMISVDGKLYFMINTFMGSDEPWFRGVDELWVFDPSCS